MLPVLRILVLLGPITLPRHYQDTSVKYPETNQLEVCVPMSSRGGSNRVQAYELLRYCGGSKLSNSPTRATVRMRAY
ncbi:hypothetical protein DER44DRAFT_784853 [Fusarium oxysporum]|nr:hypothetical protein DER44DRAFT_784853 [Fusarium oxysporum]